MYDSYEILVCAAWIIFHHRYKSIAQSFFDYFQSLRSLKIGNMQILSYIILFVSLVHYGILNT